MSTKLPWNCPACGHQLGMCEGKGEGEECVWYKSTLGGLPFPGDRRCPNANCPTPIFCEVKHIHPRKAKADPPVARVSFKVLVHLEDLGDIHRQNDEFAGTAGEARRLEGFAISEVAVPGLEVNYMAHLQDIGDVPFTFTAPEFVGTTGQARRMEGFALRLTGPNAHAYDVFYAAHLEGDGDIPFHSNGQFCGTRGKARRVEGINVIIRAKNMPAPSGSLRDVKTAPGDVPFSVRAFVEGIGFQAAVGNGHFAGTWGESKRLEGFAIEGLKLSGVELECMAHLEGIGDTPSRWMKSPGFIGTRGESRRLEGFALKLSGPAAGGYSIYYSAHLQGGFNTSLCRDGDFCGTRGEARRVEAIQVTIQPAKAAPPKVLDDGGFKLLGFRLFGSTR